MKDIKVLHDVSISNRSLTSTLYMMKLLIVVIMLMFGVILDVLDVVAVAVVKMGMCVGVVVDGKA